MKQAARALTGLGFQGRSESSDNHDDGEKTILGKSARFDADSLADHLLAQPAVADRLAWRLCATLLGEGVADAPALAELAERLRRDGLHIGRAVETILRSDWFFSARNLHTRIADPAGVVVGLARALERFDPPPSTLILAEWVGRLGQELFFPPNVGGWPGGRSWLSGRAVVARANYAAALTAGRLNSEATPPDLAGLASRRTRASDPSAALGDLGVLLTGRRLAASNLESLWQAAGAGSDDRLNRAVALLLARPDAQLA